MSDLIEFLKGTGTHPNGQKLYQILEWDDDKLEYSHDVIQWLFPLDEPSRCQPQSPFLTEEEVELLRSDEDIQINLRESVIRFSYFFENTNWITPNNHNYLRITRILKCLGVANLDGVKHFFKYIMDCYYEEYKTTIGETTKKFWDEA